MSFQITQRTNEEKQKFLEQKGRASLSKESRNYEDVKLIYGYSPRETQHEEYDVDIPLKLNENGSLDHDGTVKTLIQRAPDWMRSTDYIEAIYLWTESHNA